MHKQSPPSLFERLAATVQVLFALLLGAWLYAPLWYMLPALRPEPRATWKASIICYSLKSFLVYLCRIRISSPVSDVDAPAHLYAENTLKRSVVTKIPPVDAVTLRAGLEANPLVKETADKAQIIAIEVRGFWYGRTTNHPKHTIETGPYQPGQSVILAVHGGGGVVGSAHESQASSAMMTTLVDVSFCLLFLVRRGYQLMMTNAATGTACSLSRTQRGVPALCQTPVPCSPIRCGVGIQLPCQRDGLPARESDSARGQCRCTSFSELDALSHPAIRTTAQSTSPWCCDTNFGEATC